MNDEFQKMQSREAWDFKKLFVCDDYKSRYIEYPLTISGIEYDTIPQRHYSKEIGRFAKIRPCDSAYGGKTYLGLYLGELPTGIGITHNEESGALTVRYNNNPAIFVFEINKIIYGCESWWSFIENEAELNEITDIDIENVWYVKALKSLSTGGTADA